MEAWEGVLDVAPHMPADEVNNLCRRTVWIEGVAG